MNTILDRKGYCIPKKDLSNEAIKDMKNELTVYPIVTSDYSIVTEPFKVYRETNNYIIVPRNYGIEKFGKPKINSLSNIIKVDVTFSTLFQLRDYQRQAISDCYKAFKKTGGCILQLGTGLGKTFCSCWMIAELKGKAIIIVNTNTLKEQWTSEINKFIPNARIGYIQQNKMDVLDKDIVIAMLQSITLKEYPSEVFIGYKLAVFDETHRICSKKFSRSIFTIGAQYNLGLSATPERKDGLTKVLHFHLGQVAHKNKKTHENEILVSIYKIRNKNYKEIYTRFGKPNRPAMITKLTITPERNNLILSKIVELVNDPERQILVMTERREHALLMRDTLSQKGISSGVYFGQMKYTDLEKSKAERVLIGTSKMTLEGFDCPKLNTLVFAAPLSGNIEQGFGRILRQSHAVPTMIIDFVDCFSSFEYSGRNRERFFKSKVNSITYYNVDIVSNEIIIKETKKWIPKDSEEEQAEPEFVDSEEE